MSESNSIIQVKYLGEDSERQSERPGFGIAPPYNYYEMLVNVKGETYTVVLETSSRYRKNPYAGRRERQYDRSKPPHMRVAVNAVFGPEEREKFGEIAGTLQLKPNKNIGEIGDNVEIDLANSVLDFDFDSEHVAYPDIYEKLMKDFYQRKKKAIIQARKQSFEEIKDLPTLEKDILPQLPELAQQERATKMHNMMMQSVLTGRYGVEEYRHFMEKLVEVVRDEKVLISDDVIGAIANNHSYPYPDGKNICLFPLNSRENIINSTIEELGDVRNSSKKTSFRVVETEPIKPEHKGYIDNEFKNKGAVTLGRINSVAEDKIRDMIRGRKRTNDSRGGFYVGQGEDGNIIFGEYPDWLIENEIAGKDEEER